MKRMLQALLIGIICFGLLSVSVTPTEAGVINGRDFCESNGGTWSGGNDFSGDCKYPPGSAGHSLYDYCSADQYLIIIYAGITSRDQGRRFSRSYVPPVVGPQYRCENIIPPYGKCGNEIKFDDGAGSLIACNRVYLEMFYEAGACAGKCTLSPSILPSLKKTLSQLDGTVIGEAYIKLRNPSGGSYKVCMGGEGTIYRWVSGAWVALPTQTVNGISCAWVSGDGNFVLVE